MIFEDILLLSIFFPENSYVKKEKYDDGCVDKKCTPQKLFSFYLLVFCGRSDEIKTVDTQTREFLLNQNSKNIINI